MGNFILTLIAGVGVLCSVALLAVRPSLEDKGEANKATSSTPLLEALAELAEKASRKIRDSKESPKKVESGEQELVSKLKALQARLDAVEADRLNERAAFNDELVRKAAVLEADSRANGTRLTGSGSVVPAVLAVERRKVVPEKEPSADEEDVERAKPQVCDSPQSARGSFTETYPRRQGLIRRIFGRCRIFQCLRR